MRNLATLRPQHSRSSEIDSAIGQIDLIGETGEIIRSWRIRSPKCTLGSAPDCSVQLTSAGVSPLHATLIFGKRHTLLRSAGPTLISNRHVREWLIDGPTEIVVGQSRLIIHPSIGVLATVVNAENLLDQAARLCKEPTRIVSELQDVAVPNPSQAQPVTSNGSVEPTSSSKLDAIEQLLLSLQSTLGKLQESVDLDSKNANETIVESVSQEIDDFGKRLFSNLNDQLSNQTGVQQSLITNLSDRFTDRFGSIDEQLNRFSEASNLQTSSLNELLALACSDKEIIETRFNEVLSHRNELLEAVQVLRSEIAVAYQASASQSRQISYRSDSHSTDCDPEIQSGESSSVTDDQLAHSLELAQSKIQELNSQLKSLETERDSAQQRFLKLAQLSEPTNLGESVSDLAEVQQSFNDEILYQDPQYSVVQKEDLNYETPQYEAPQYEAPQYEAPQYEAVQYEAVQLETSQLPAWFKQDVLPRASDGYELESAHRDQSQSSVDCESLSVPINLSSESENGCQSEELAEQNPAFDAPESNFDSISERLQRMLDDAGQRRGSANPASERLSTRSWSQKHGGKSSDIAVENVQVEGVMQSEDVAQRNDLPDSEESFYDANSIQQAGTETKAGAHANIEPGVDVEPKEVRPSFPAVTTDRPMAGNRSNVDEEDSIEQYMQRLLHRVRGGEGDHENTASKATKTPIGLPNSAATPTKPRSRVAASMGLEISDVKADPNIERLREELFVPRQQAPEQRTDLDALRELANTNARRAITRSDIRRTNSAFYLKLCVTAVAVFSAVALFLFNGLTLNAPFVGMIAAIIVAILWGYDCVNHFKRLKNVGGMNKVTAAETAAGQSIRVGSTDEESGWRPTPT